MNIKLIKTCLIMIGMLSFFLVACASINIDATKFELIKIPEQFLGFWVELNKGVEGDSLIITSENIRWKRTDAFNAGEYTFKSGQVDDGTVVKIAARNACRRDFVGFQADGPARVTIKRKGEELILDISRSTVARAGFQLTCPAVTRVFKKSANLGK